MASITLMILISKYPRKEWAALIVIIKPEILNTRLAMLRKGKKKNG